MRPAGEGRFAGPATLALALFAVLPHGGMAVPVSPAQFAREAAEAQVQGGAPGLVAAALWKGKAPLVVASGMADFSTGLSVTAQTSFLWFSVTKLFTAVEIMRLVERGRLRLDTPVASLLPQFQYANPYGVTVTVAHLLSHTSGLPKPGVLANFRAIHLASELGPPVWEVLKRWSPTGAALVSCPGERFTYNNAGYLWLGQVIEALTGRPYGRAIDEDILKPLGMDHSGFVHQDMALAARGYGKTWSLTGFIGHATSDRKFHAPAPPGLNGISQYYVDTPSVSGLVGPMDDMVKFARMLLDHGQGPTGAILKPETLDSMFQPRRNREGGALPIGLGFWLEGEGAEASAFQQGTGGGFRTELRLYPQKGYATLVAANLLNFDTHPLAKTEVEP
jgi:CubicO group peptidase (beta-lactamase class C family)